MNCEVKTPWAAHMDGVPMHLEYPDCSMADLVEHRAQERPDVVSFDFFGVKNNSSDYLEILGLHESEIAMQEVDIFTFEEKYKDYLSPEQADRFVAQTTQKVTAALNAYTGALPERCKP